MKNSSHNCSLFWWLILIFCKLLKKAISSALNHLLLVHFFCFVPLQKVSFVLLRASVLMRKVTYNCRIVTGSMEMCCSSTTVWVSSPRLVTSVCLTLGPSCWYASSWGSGCFYDVQPTWYKTTVAWKFLKPKKKKEPVSFQVTINILCYLQPSFFSLYRKQF